MRFGNLRFALDDGAVLHNGIKSDVFFAGGNDAAFDGKNFRRRLERSLHVARDFVHCRDKQVAEAVSRKFAVAAETVLEEFFHKRLGVGKRDKTVAQIARRNNSEFLAQTSRTAAVICNGDHGGDIVRRRFNSAQKDAQAVPAADNRDGRSAPKFALLID